MGLTVLPPDVNASEFRCTGQGRELRIGLQFVKELSAEGVERLLAARGENCMSHPERSEGGHVGSWPLHCVQGDSGGGRAAVRPFRSLTDLRARTGIAPADLRALIKVGALDSIAGGWTRPMLLWLVDATAEPARSPDARAGGWFDQLPPTVPALKEYGPDRRRREEHAALGFTTDAHPMRLYADELRRFRLCPSTELHRHVGEHVLAAGMLTTAKPVHTLKDEPMEFATFDDGDGLIETVLFPDVYRERGHVLFDQGPFIFRGKVEEEFGAVTLTVTQLDRLERMLAKVSSRARRGPTT
jgi:DNA polymerase III alpha subunit